MTRLVRLLNDMHGLDDGVRHAGDVLEVDEGHAQSWIGRSVAEYADGLDARGRRVDPAPSLKDPSPVRVPVAAAAGAVPAAALPRPSGGSKSQSRKAR